MYIIEKEHKWLVLMNGREVIHGPIENTVDTCTASGQPFAIYGDTKDYVVDLAFSEYIEEDESVGVIEEVKTLRDITWIINYTQQEAEDAKSDFNMASINAKVSYIKHPDREEYSLPMQQEVFETVPDGVIKDRMLAVVVDKITGSDILTSDQMIENGWF